MRLLSLEETLETRPRKRDTRWAVLNSVMLRQILLDGGRDGDSRKDRPDRLPTAKHPPVHFWDDREDDPARRHPRTASMHSSETGL